MANRIRRITWNAFPQEKYIPIIYWQHVLSPSYRSNGMLFLTGFVESKSSLTHIYSGIISIQYKWHWKIHSSMQLRKELERLRKCQNIMETTNAKKKKSLIFAACPSSVLPFSRVLQKVITHNPKHLSSLKILMTQDQWTVEIWPLYYSTKLLRSKSIRCTCFMYNFCTHSFAFIQLYMPVIKYLLHIRQPQQNFV